MRGVYAVGRPELTPLGRWMAVVLASGEGAALSHRSAAALWGIGPRGAGAFEVTVPSSAGRGREVPGVRTHRRTGLERQDFTRCKGIPVTKSVLTLVDIAGLGRRGGGMWLGDGDVERAVNEADRLDLVDPEALRAGLERYGGRRGVARLRELLTGARSGSPTRTRATLSTARDAGRIAGPSHSRTPQRLSHRLLLARPAVCGRDRWAALPPHSCATGTGSSTRPGASRCRVHRRSASPTIRSATSGASFSRRCGQFALPD